MFFVYDTMNKKTIGCGNELRMNAERKAQKANITHCGIEEVDKPKEKRRFVIIEQ